jgi:acyl-CoA dehydrogenase
MPGITVRRIKTTGWWMSYTAHIVFDNVKASLRSHDCRGLTIFNPQVPVANLIGEENQGFVPIMTNFNMERFGGIVMCLRFARVCLQDAVEYAKVRKTFGKVWWNPPACRGARCLSRVPRIFGI